jgi:hypothetical protein
MSKRGWPVHKPPSGVPAKGVWEQFKPGHELRRTHGAYMPKLSSDETVIAAAEQLTALAPIATPADGPVAMLLAVSLERVRRALHHVEQLEAEGEPVPERLAGDLRGWVRESARLCDQLALSPTARARLGLHVVRSQSELADYLRSEYGGESDLQGPETGEIVGQADPVQAPVHTETDGGDS